jgi:hypothetical protein
VEYYGIMRKRFRGWQTTGAGGAQRIWDRALPEVRAMLASSRDPAAKAALAEIEELDRQSAPPAATP